jgi:probable aminopeptidase NPEPL1
MLPAVPTTLSFAQNLPALLQGSRAVLVVAPASVFAGELPALLPGPAQALLGELARDTKPGDLGGVGSSLTGLAEPRRLSIGVLPDHVSRYNSPARAESVRKVVAGADLGNSGKAGVVLLLPDPAHLLAAVNAVARALPLFTQKSAPAAGFEVQVIALDLAGQPIPVPPEVEATAHATRTAAQMVDTPPTDLNPEEFATRAKDLLAGIPRVEVREFVGDALLKEGFVGVHSVGRCAVKPPRVVVAQYTPPQPGGRAIALVGKGITYDTGGLSLKLSGAMNSMKGDLGGAAAVLGAFTVLAGSGCKHTLSLILCIAENAVGPAAYKPDDILRLHSGKTVEINNTDAEGRLLLADGVSYAARNLGADIVFDAATLTGAQLTSR